MKKIKISLFFFGFILLTFIILIYVSITPKHTSPIKHIIIIFQENHAFDNYFGTYPGADGFSSNICEPYNPKNLSWGCVKPFQTNDISQPGMSHTWQGSHTAYDNGSMDGFVFNGGSNSMSYYTNTTILYYWDYARHYVLLDHLFSSVLSYSLPNHWYEIAGQAPNTSIYYLEGGAPGKNPLNAKTLRTSNGVITNIGYQYLSQANNITTLADELQFKNISWKYYANQQMSINYSRAMSTGSVFDYWNPLYAKNISYTKSYISHFADLFQLFNDVQNGTLPNVAWVSPPAALSEHPPANVTWGMWYVTDIINTVEQSKYWNNTVIIVMWDDWGGYYDGVTPPQVDQYGLSFRVPGLVISPYAKHGYIDHTQYDFESTMKFIEWNWNITSLTSRDVLANNLLNAFNFSQTPSKPYLIPLNQTQIQIVRTNMKSWSNSPNGTNYLNETNSTNIPSPIIWFAGIPYNASDFDT